MQKQWVEIHLENIHIEDLVGSVNDAITYLAELSDPYVDKNYKNFRLCTVSSWDTPDSVDLKADRKETDKEFNRRKNRVIAASKAVVTKRGKQKIKDMKTLARLQKKYGKIE